MSRDSAIINERIRTQQVRLIRDGKQVGILNTRDALIEARNSGMDLIQINENDDIPVCIIADYGKWAYERQVASREASKKQRQTRQTLKELQLRPGIADNDLTVKINKAREFIADGDSVLFKLKLRGREMSHPEIQQAVMDSIIGRLSDIADVTQPIKNLGRDWTVTVGPTKKSVKAA